MISDFSSPSKLPATRSVQKGPACGLDAYNDTVVTDRSIGKKTCQAFFRYGNYACIIFLYRLGIDLCVELQAALSVWAGDVVTRHPFMTRRPPPYLEVYSPAQIRTQIRSQAPLWYTFCKGYSMLKQRCTVHSMQRHCFPLLNESTPVRYHVRLDITAFASIPVKLSAYS